MNPTVRKYGLWALIYVFGVVMGRVSVHPTDRHFPPDYGKSGLPANCSAYVDVAIAGYRSRTHTAEETMAGLQRNCGAGGHLWQY